MMIVLKFYTAPKVPPGDNEATVGEILLPVGVEKI